MENVLKNCNKQKKIVCILLELDIWKNQIYQKIRNIKQNYFATK